MMSQIFLAQLTRTNVSLASIQAKLASGHDVQRPSDDAVRASAIGVLDDRLERTQQRMNNLGLASNTLGLLDTTLGDATDLVREARSIASSQIGLTSDTETRRNQAVVIDSMIQELVNLGNRQTRGVYVFGGSTPNTQPIVPTNLGYRYVGRGSGLITDIDLGDRVPVTLGGENAIGSLSSRIRGTTDLDPVLTGGTRLSDLNGARGLGISEGAVTFSFNGGPDATIDLTGADTVQNVIDRVTAGIRQYENDNGVTILGPGGVSVAGGSLTVDVVGGAPAPQLTFRDQGGGTTAADLGLTSTPFVQFGGVGDDLSPRVTLLTPVSALSNVTTPLGSIRVRFTQGATSSYRDVDLSSAQTVDDIRRLIESTGLGVRVTVNDAGTGINVVNEISGPGLSIEEIPGGANTATELGIRSMSAATATTDFNEGRGVRIVDGSTDPVTGAPDPARDVDFTIHLGNGDSFGVDLRPQDLATVQTVIDRINSQAADAVAAGDIPAGAFTAGLTDGANGIAFFDTLNLGAISVTKENNSAAAQDLGLLGGAFDAGSATFVAQDRAAARVDNLLTTLIDLRDALRNDDSDGIAVAGERLETHVDQLSASQALVGVYSQRVEKATQRQEDLSVLDQQAKSQLQDLDYAAASVRFSLLQTQLQAGLTVGAQSQTRTLLDFLG
jgi:flagellar hook-associated protein 3 FlgL